MPTDARECSRSIPVLTGTVTHAAAVTSTLTEPGAAFNRSESRETILLPASTRLRSRSPGRSVSTKKSTVFHDFLVETDRPGLRDLSRVLAGGRIVSRLSLRFNVPPGFWKSWMDRRGMCPSLSKHVRPTRRRSRMFPGDSEHPSRPQMKKHFFVLKFRNPERVLWTHS